jgi:hypothetical protein
MVALKVEKADKSKKVLVFEYQVLKHLQGLPNICKIYEFVESDQPNGSNFIVMQMLGILYCNYFLLGKNLSNIKRLKGRDFTPIFALKLLVFFALFIRQIASNAGCN